MNMETVVINNLFKSAIRRLKDEEFKQLEQNILTEGCRDPLVLWGDVLVDGHHRYEICTKHGKDFTTVQRDFDSEEAVVDWMIDNQLGKRNLTPDEFKYYLGMKYNRLKKAANDGGKGTVKTEDQNDPRLSTAEKLAEEHGVSAPTVKRAGAVVAKIEEATPEVKEAVQAGKVPVNVAADIADLPEEEQQEIVEEIEAGGKPAEVINRYHHTSQKNNDWYTPSKYIEAARRVMGDIDCDPATSELAQQTVQAGVFFTQDDDGLKQEWEGAVWMNPPYSMPEIQNFIDKLLESDGVQEWIVLTNNSSDTGWFHQLLMESDYACFTKGRVQFENGSEVMATRQGQTFFYKGHNAETFVEEFRKFGSIVEVVHDFAA